MTAPPLSACAEMVRRLDPDLFHAALFAPEPARERLMVLYAFDIELSKAAVATAEPLIARMRLQWWRDLVDGIAAGEPPRQHDVAGPLHEVLTGTALPPEDLAALVDARESELDLPMDEQRFATWIDNRFGALTRLAALLLTRGDGGVRQAANAVGGAMGTAFALRTAMPMAASNRFLLPGLTPEDRSAMTRGEITDHADAVARELSVHPLSQLHAARAQRRAVPAAAMPALLSVWRAERVLKRGTMVPMDEANGQRARGAILLWRALRGRW